MRPKAALDAGEHRAVDSLGLGRPAEDIAALGPTQRLVGGARHKISVGHRAGMQSRRHQAADVGLVHQQQGPDLVTDLAEPGEIQPARVGTAAHNDHLWLRAAGQVRHRLIVDLFRHPVDVKGREAVETARETQPVAVGKVSPMAQRHAQDGVARLQRGQIDGRVGINPRMGLDVGVFRPEQRFGPLDSQPLYCVGLLAPWKVAPARIPFHRQVGQQRALGGQDGLIHRTLRGDELDRTVLPDPLALQNGADLGVDFPQDRHRLPPPRTALPTGIP